jgi:minichromosome maintenance protein 10
MDELLALMGESCPDDAKENIVKTSNKSQTKAKDVRQRQDRPVLSTVPATSSTPAFHKPTPFHNPTETAVDEKVGIRMTNRIISSLDLLDLISENPYHSPATISAMSRAHLNNLLVEPSSVISAETVCGRTNILTLGIVFENSGTRISSKGSAFSLLKIGNLVTGPCCAVFLFGDAYSQYTTKLKAGMVVAFLSPNLVPPNPKGTDTAVALSVRDTKQVLNVAKAQDYGICQGSTRTHNGSINPCKHFVDTRVSSYCSSHRAQVNVTNGAVSMAKKGQSFVQKLRQDGVQPLPKYQKGTMTITLASGAVVASYVPQTKLSNNSILNPASTTNFFSTTPPIVTPSQAPRLNRAPIHMKKGQVIPPILNNHSTVVNPYQKGPLPKTRPLVGKRGQNIPKHIESDWLAPSAIATKKRRNINTAGTCGFNGTVIIPKPNKLFRSSTPHVEQQPVNPCVSHETKTAIMADKQRQLAALLMKTNPISKEGVPVIMSHKVDSTPTAADKSLRESFFGKFSSVDTEQMLSAKSRFADEADAEAYAKSRRVVSDLERRETVKDQKDAKIKKASGGDTKIEKEWICTTCNGRRSRVKPNICFRQNHKVRLERAVKSTTNEADKRSQLNKADVEEGGLMLGAGLDWSGFQHTSEE